MSLKTLYDDEVDVLHLSTGVTGATSASLYDFPDVIVDLADDEGRHVVAVEVIGASAYLPLGRHGYDREQDALTMGDVASDPACVTVHGDIVTYWQEQADADPIGVTLRQASKHLDGLR